MNIYPIPLAELPRYSTVPMTFTVDSIFRVEPIENGFGGLRLIETPVPNPYMKNYDDYDSPLKWTRDFDVSSWAFFLAEEDDRILGGATVAWNTNGVNMLEGRIDMSVLWDIRVHPDARGKGIGKELFLTAAQWSREHGCVRMKVETQNNNVRACKFYQHMGCELGAIRKYAYREPELQDEVMLLWYLSL
jgi:GNAT superfamily N-acetyltransferase